MTRSGKTTSLALAGLAAFAYYKYSKMSAEDKSTFLSDIKEKGRSIMDKILPENLRNLFGNSATGKSTEPGFGETGF